jgi:acyl-CoA synthetase (NDP forming)
MWRRQQWLASLADSDEPILPEQCDPDAARAILESAPPGGWLAPGQADDLLRAYRIPTPRMGLAPDLDSALALAGEIGYPVALKLAAKGVIHKSDVGGIALNIAGPDALRAGYDAIMARAARHAPEAKFEGVAVQQMIPAGVELIIGTVRDAQFGPLVMVGVGGALVELLRDVAFELAPLSPAQADAMLDRTRAGMLLAGVRGAPPADRGVVVDIIVRLAQMARDHPALAEVEINPLIAGEGGAWAVDARARAE